VVLGTTVAGGSAVGVQVIGTEADRATVDEGTRVGVGEIKGEGVTETALPMAVDLGTGMIGFR
jgi:hypothetical protein